MRMMRNSLHTEPRRIVKALFFYTASRFTSKGSQRHLNT